MKKTFILFAMAALIISCGNNENKQPTNTTAGNQGGDNNGGAMTATQDMTNNPDYKKGFALVGSSDCFGCHSVSSRINGPAYKEVAERYAGKGDAIVDSLANKIINGGAGNWGEIAMTPHPNLSQDDARAMVKYILLLNQQ